MLDADQIGMQFHVAGAVGGVKVAVRPEDAARARELLALDHAIGRSLLLPSAHAVVVEGSGLSDDGGSHQPGGDA